MHLLCGGRQTDEIHRLRHFPRRVTMGRKHRTNLLHGTTDPFLILADKLQNTNHITPDSRLRSKAESTRTNAINAPTEQNFKALGGNGPIGAERSPVESQGEKTGSIDNRSTSKI
jgi:hypothetical protein